MAQTIEIDLHLTATQKTALRNALTTLETLVNAPKYQMLITYWGQMDAETRQMIMERAPLLARLIAVAARLPRVG